MKNRTPALLFALIIMLGMLCSACVYVEAPASCGTAGRIGIISAMDNEIAYLLSEAEIERVDTIGDVEFHVGTLRGRPVVISRAGVGKVRAASGLTAMLNRYPVSKVLVPGWSSMTTARSQTTALNGAADTAARTAISPPIPGSLNLHTTPLSG